MLINGKNYDWANLDVIVFGVPLTTVTEIDYSESQDKVLNYGIGNKPTSYGTKNVMFAASISMQSDELRLIQDLAPGKSILNITPFDISILFDGLSVIQRTDILNNCMFTTNPFSAKQNDSLFIVKLPLLYAGITRK